MILNKYSIILLKEKGGKYSLQGQEGKWEINFPTKKGMKILHYSNIGDKAKIEKYFFYKDKNKN